MFFEENPASQSATFKPANLHHFHFGADSHFTLDNMASRNPLILSKTMRIRGANGSLFYFNITTGALLEAASKEIKEIDYNWDQSESIDPFGFRKSKEQEASDSSQDEKTNEE